MGIKGKKSIFNATHKGIMKLKWLSRFKPIDPSMPKQDRYMY
jgi:hypothetical protein